MRFRSLLALMLLMSIVVMVAACGESSNNNDNAKREVDHAAKRLSPYLPKNDVEFSNYNRAQRIYDSPDTILWCTFTWNNPSAPLVTVPIVGKLTSSTTTFFNPVDVLYNGETGIATIPARSVDKLFHPNPPAYRYGFTPGDQYADFTDLSGPFCTTAMSSFQRQSTQVSISIDRTVFDATRRAEAALGRGDNAGAQKILQEAIGNG